MFSSFSFGKIIKTILPGVILTAALLLLLESIWALSRPHAGLLLGRIPAGWITPVTAALIPITMILGFFLNTFSWRLINPQMRKRSEALLERTVYAALRRKLSDGVWSESQQYFNDLAQSFSQVQFPERTPLEYFYLPRIKLTNLNYLWESYFCWYEFDVNSACAFVVLGPAAAWLLWLKVGWCYVVRFIAVLVFLASSWALYRALTRAAMINLASYEKNLVLLITGSLVEASENVELLADEEDEEII